MRSGRASLRYPFCGEGFGLLQDVLNGGVLQVWWVAVLAERSFDLTTEVRILLQHSVVAGWTVAIPDETDRIDREEQSYRASIGRDFGAEHVRVPEWKTACMEPIRALVEQVPEIDRRLMGRREKQQHRSSRGGCGRALFG